MCVSKDEKTKCILNPFPWSVFNYYYTVILEKTFRMKMIHLLILKPLTRHFKILTATSSWIGCYFEFDVCILGPTSQLHVRWFHRNNITATMAPAAPPHWYVANIRTETAALVQWLAPSEPPHSKNIWILQGIHNSASHGVGILFNNQRHWFLLILHLKRDCKSSWNGRYSYQNIS